MLRQVKTRLRGTFQALSTGHKTEKPTAKQLTNILPPNTSFSPSRVQAQSALLATSKKGKAQVPGEKSRLEEAARPKRNFSVWFPSVMKGLSSMRGFRLGKPQADLWTSILHKHVFFAPNRAQVTKAGPFEWVMDLWGVHLHHSSSANSRHQCVAVRSRGS